MLFVCSLYFFVFAKLQKVCQLLAIWTSLSKQMLTWYVYCDDVVPLVCKVYVYFNKKLDKISMWFYHCLSCLAVTQWNLLGDMNLARH